MFIQLHVFHKLISLFAWLAWTKSKGDCGREKRKAGLCDTKRQHRVKRPANRAANWVKSCRRTTRVGGLVLMGLPCHASFLSSKHRKFAQWSNPLRSRLYEEARTSLLCNFPRRFREFIVPCFVSDGISSEGAMQEQPPWRYMYVPSCPGRLKACWTLEKTYFNTD